MDLLGARVEGLPPGPRYPLPDNWPEGEHPLLKDWTPKAAAPEASEAGAQAAAGAAAKEGAPDNE